MATTLPSFVELMASLGLDQPTSARDTRLSPSTSPRASPPLSISRDASPPIPRSSSSASLKDIASSRSRSARYTPYSPKLLSARRGSVSSISSSSSASDTSSTSTSSSPRMTTSQFRKRSHQLTINVCESTNDLSANTPISSYVRRKTPGTSPTSTSFPREDLPPCLTPLSLPTLPPLPPLSGSSDEFPITPESNPFAELDPPAFISGKSKGSYGRMGRPTGTRLSTSPLPVRLSHRIRRRQIDHVE
ncbi:hypothetical protein BDN71DRAFT_1503949 [Pleurotus eryngii]|uniref:Uncharacterized protein n=1 Tax=Pleurotus eryngii TaxID=5323 RepID=A0A9P6D9T9_PLEER|nr:hypothetical protein BDN71DRAFT_1503949 [Pleurotus eryngii]